MFKNYKVDILLIFLATFPTSASLAFDYLFLNEYYWFQRSGSLMVLFGVILDFHQNKFPETKLSSNVFMEGQPAVVGQTLPKLRKYLQTFSIALAVLGTFIWGYGDIPFK